MKLYLVVLDSERKLKPWNYNPVLGVFQNKQEAEILADKKYGYFVLERELENLVMKVG